MARYSLEVTEVQFRAPVSHSRTGSIQCELVRDQSVDVIEKGPGRAVIRVKDCLSTDPECGLLAQVTIESSLQTDKEIAEGSDDKDLEAVLSTCFAKTGLTIAFLTETSGAAPILLPPRYHKGRKVVGSISIVA